MSQALRNATERLANALYGAPFFFSFSVPLLYLLHIAPSFSLVQGTEPEVIALNWQRGLCSDFFPSRPLRPHWAGSPRDGNVLPRSNCTRGPPSLVVVQLVLFGVYLRACVRACDQVVGDTRSLLLFIWPASLKTWGSEWDTMYRCLAPVWKRRKTTERGM